MRLRIATEDFPSTTDPFDIIGLPFYPIEFASEGLNEALRERGHQFWRCRGKRYVSLDTEMDDDRQTAVSPLAQSLKCDYLHSVTR